MAPPYTNAEDFKRLRRLERPNHARAVNFSCFHNQPFFRSPRALDWFISAAKQSLARHAVHLWCFCVMPTHVHLLVYTPDPRPDIGGFLESLKKSVARRAYLHVHAHAPQMLAKMEDRQPNGLVSTRFWQRGGGYDRNLVTSRAIWEMIRYIHANPVVEGLCARPEDWSCSSAAAYANLGSSPIPLDLTHLPPGAGAD